MVNFALWLQNFRIMYQKVSKVPPQFAISWWYHNHQMILSLILNYFLFVRVLWFMPMSDGYSLRLWSTGSMQTLAKYLTLSRVMCTLSASVQLLTYHWLNWIIAADILQHCTDPHNIKVQAPLSLKWKQSRKSYLCFTPSLSSFE